MVPKPTVTPDTLKTFTAATWIGLGQLAACATDREVRERSAALIERAVEVYRIESYDEFRSRLMALGDPEALRSFNETTRHETLPEHVEACRGGLRLASKQQIPDGPLSGLGSALLKEAGIGGFDYCVAMVVAWDAAAWFRADPDRSATEDEWHELVNEVLERGEHD